MNRLLFTSK